MRVAATLSTFLLLVQYVTCAQQYIVPIEGEPLDIVIKASHAHPDANNDNANASPRWMTIDEDPEDNHEEDDREVMFNGRALGPGAKIGGAFVGGVVAGVVGKQVYNNQQAATAAAGGVPASAAAAAPAPAAPAAPVRRRALVDESDMVQNHFQARSVAPSGSVALKDGAQALKKAASSLAGKASTVKGKHVAVAGAALVGTGAAVGATKGAYKVGKAKGEAKASGGNMMARNVEHEDALVRRAGYKAIVGALGVGAVGGVAVKHQYSKNKNPAAAGGLAPEAAPMRRALFSASDDEGQLQARATLKALNSVKLPASVTAFKPKGKHIAIGAAAVGGTAATGATSAGAYKLGKAKGEAKGHAMASGGESNAPAVMKRSPDESQLQARSMFPVHSVGSTFKPHGLLKRSENEVQLQARALAPPVGLNALAGTKAIQRGSLQPTGKHIAIGAAAIGGTAATGAASAGAYKLGKSNGVAKASGAESAASTMIKRSVGDIELCRRAGAKAVLAAVGVGAGAGMAGTHIHQQNKKILGLQGPQPM